MKSISRREFLRIAGLMGGASLFAGCTLLGDNAPVPEYIKGAPATDPVETLAGINNLYTVCGLCPGNCGICCRIAEGTVVKIGGSPFHPASCGNPLPFATTLGEALTRSGSVCAIGGSGIQTLYDPFRVARPLKRVGPRGSGKWTAVSWEQALTEIIGGGDLFGEGRVSGLNEITQAGEGLEFLVGRADWGALTFINRFVAAFPGATLVRDRETEMIHAARAAAESVFGPGIGPVDADYSNARCVISFGDAPLDSGIPLVALARKIADARVGSRGFQWAVIDPRLSTSASKSDQWVPVIPGEDLTLAFGIMRHLLDHNPGMAASLDENLKQTVMARSVRGHAESCGVSIDTAARVAGMIVESGEKSAVIPGRGIVAGPNGVQAAAVILNLNLLVGSVPGSGGLAFRNDDFLVDAYKKVMARTERGKETAAAGTSKALLLWEADPVYDEPSKATVFQDLKKNPLIVAIDKQITETTALADYILPDTTYLERWDICVSPPAITVNGIGVRHPVVGALEPRSGKYFPILPETRVMEEILADFAFQLKLPSFETPGNNPAKPKFTASEYYRNLVGTVVDSMQKVGMPIAVSQKDIAEVFDRGGFFASDSKREIKKEVKRPAKPPLMAAVASKTEPAPVRESEFLLISYSQPFHRTPVSGINSWLLEVLPENRLIMNNSDAKKLGMARHDRVLVQTGDGKAQAECRVHIMPGIRPGVVALAQGFGYRQAGAMRQIINGASRSADKTRGAGVNVFALASVRGTTTVKVTKI